MVSSLHMCKHASVARLQNCRKQLCKVDKSDDNCSGFPTVWFAGHA